MIQLLSHATVFVCPSIYEPLGIVNLEAMACETAVVATRTGGIPEVVEDGVTGLLVPVRAARRRLPRARRPGAVRARHRDARERAGRAIPAAPPRWAAPAVAAPSSTSPGTRLPSRRSICTARCSNDPSPPRPAGRARLVHRAGGTSWGSGEQPPVEGLVQAAEVEAAGEIEPYGGIVDVLGLHPQAARARCSRVLRERLQERGAEAPTALRRRDVEVRDRRAPVPGRRLDLREAHHAAVCLGDERPRQDRSPAADRTSSAACASGGQARPEPRLLVREAVDAVGRERRVDRRDGFGVPRPVARDRHGRAGLRALRVSARSFAASSSVS